MKIQRLDRRLAAERDAAEKLADAVRLMRDCLPDSATFGQCGTWAWNEIDCEGQERVKRARDVAKAALAEYEAREGK